MNYRYYWLIDVHTGYKTVLFIHFTFESRMEWYSYDQNVALPAIEGHLNDHKKDIVQTSNVILDNSYFHNQLYPAGHTNTLFIRHKYIHERYLFLFIDNFMVFKEKENSEPVTKDIVLVKDKRHTHSRKFFLLTPILLNTPYPASNIFTQNHIWSSEEKFVKEWNYYLNKLR